MALCSIPEGLQAPGPRTETGAGIRLSHLGRGLEKRHPIALGPGFMQSCIPASRSLLSSARDRAWVLSSVSRLKDAGLGGEGAGQGEPRRKPVGEEGKSQREGREAKTPIQCKPANEF